MYDFIPISSRLTICSSVGMITNDGREAMKDVPKKGFRNSYPASGRERQSAVPRCNWAWAYAGLPFLSVKSVQIIQGTMRAILVKNSVAATRPNGHPVEDLYNIHASCYVQSPRQMCLCAVILKPLIKIAVFASHIFRLLQIDQFVAITSQEWRRTLFVPIFLSHSTTLPYFPLPNVFFATQRGDVDVPDRRVSRRRISSSSVSPAVSLSFTSLAVSAVWYQLMAALCPLSFR